MGKKANPSSDCCMQLHCRIKEKIMNKHPECFPGCGKIKINALKVKRKGFFYHLVDSMLVISAFRRDNKCWFLSVDACSVELPNENEIPNKPEDTNQLALFRFEKTTSGDSSSHPANVSFNKITDNCGRGNSCNEVEKDLEMDVQNVAADPFLPVFPDFHSGLDSTNENQKQPSDRHLVSQTKAKRDDPQVRVNDVQCNNSPEGSIINDELGENKNRKSKKKNKLSTSNFAMKDDGDIDKHSLGKTVTEIQKDTEMKNIDACNIIMEANACHKDVSEVVVDDNQNNNPLDGSFRSGPGAKKKHKTKKKIQTDNIDACTLVSETKAIHKDDDSQVGVDNQCNNLLNGSFRSGPGANTKQKSKKKSEDATSNCTVKVDNVKVDMHSSNKIIREVPVEVEMVNNDVVKGPYRTSYDDTTNLRSLKTSVVTWGDESKNLVCDAQGTAPPEEASKSLPVSRKRKRRKSEQSDNPQENNVTLVKSDIVPSSSVSVKHKNNTTSKENLMTETPEDVNLGARTSSEKGRRKKKRSLRDQEVFVEPPCPNGGEICMEGEETVSMTVDTKNVESIDMNVDTKNAENVTNDIDRASDSTYVSRTDVQLAIPSSAEDTHLVDAEGGDTNRSSRNEEVSQKNEETMQKQTGKMPETKSRLKEKENKLDFLQQNITELTENNSGGLVAKPKKKSKKIQNASGEMRSASLNKENKVGAEELIPSKIRNNAAENVSEAKKLGKSSSKNHSTVKDLEPKKNIGDGHGSMSSTVDSTQAPSPVTHISNSSEKPLKHVDGGVLHNPSMSDVDRQVDVSKSANEKINFLDYFLPRDKGEAPVAEPVVKVKLNSTQLSYENGSESKSLPKISTVIEQKEANRSAVGAKKKIDGKVSFGNSHVTVAKSRMGEVVNSSQREKSLLKTRASIFWDNSSESSEDSDSSTKAPSDDSSTSSDSEEERADSARGIDYESSKKEKKTPRSKCLDLNTILRSSSSFKEAKISASQSQLEDTDGLPADYFVPESPSNS